MTLLAARFQYDHSYGDAHRRHGRAYPGGDDYAPATAKVGDKLHAEAEGYDDLQSMGKKRKENEAVADLLNF